MILIKVIYLIYKQHTMEKHEGQAIAFAVYKNDKLIGYRQDSFGSLGTEWAKIYTYSEEQVKTVMDNIGYQIEKRGDGIGKAFKSAGYEGDVLNRISAQEQKSYEKLGKVFEVRVLKCPERIEERTFNISTASWETNPYGEYPTEAMKTWLAAPETHETIESKLFTFEGQVNLQ